LAETVAPSPKQIAAVQKVLYARTRLRKIFDEGESIVRLMNLDPGAALDNTDPRWPAGSGPSWFVPATKKLNPSVAEAAQRCERIADLLVQIRAELTDVDFPSSDKQHLRAALAESAAEWRARGRLWRAPAAPGDAQAAAASVTAHQRASLREFQRVTAYLKDVDPGRFR
jgi:hypothetical protein